jgi:hypothetical protein
VCSGRELQAHFGIQGAVTGTQRLAEGEERRCARAEEGHVDQENGHHRCVYGIRARWRGQLRNERVDF